MIQITHKPFDICSLGNVDCITLRNDAGMEVEVLTLGATMCSIVVPSKDGTPTDVLLGYDQSQHYLDRKAYLGGTIGRYANRIGGASFSLEGQEIQVTANQDNTHHLHGGQFGYDKRLWRYAIHDEYVSFYLEDLHMEEGFPGDVEVEVQFALSEDNRLTVTHLAKTDRTTVVSITNHPYFNLDGHGAGTVENHLAQIDAQFYTPCNNAGIPTGEVCQVAGTPVDLRVLARLGNCIHHSELEVTRGLDHNFVLNHTPNKPVAMLRSLESGIALDVTTTLPGFQIYTGGFIGEQIAKAGIQYHNHSGVALEPQYFPNSMNVAHFPSPVLLAGEHYRHQIAYEFSTL